MTPLENKLVRDKLDEIWTKVRDAEHEAFKENENGKAHKIAYEGRSKIHDLQETLRIYGESEK